jgi:hypothetical protein
VITASILIVAIFAEPILWASMDGDARGTYTDLHFASGSRRLKGVSIGDWVPIWSGFPATDGKTLFLIDQFGAQKSLDWHQHPKSATWSIDPKGKYIAKWSNSAEDEFVEVLTESGNTILALDRKSLASRLGLQQHHPALMDGLAWSPSSRTLAFSTRVGGMPDTSGSTGPRTVLYDLARKKLHILGKGAPIVWVGEDRLLLATNYETKGDYQDVWLVDRKGRASRKVSGVIPAGFDGRHIVLLRPAKYGVREMWSPQLDRCVSRLTLKHPSTLNVPDYVRVPPCAGNRAARL